MSVALIVVGSVFVLAAHVMVFVLALRLLEGGPGRASAVRAATYPTLGDQLEAEFRALEAGKT